MSIDVVVLMMGMVMEIVVVEGDDFVCGDVFVWV